MPKPKPKAPVLSPREYYESVMNMLVHARKLDPTDAKAIIEKYKEGDPDMLDAALALAAPREVKVPGAWEMYERYRSNVGEPVEKIRWMPGYSRDPTEEYANMRGMVSDATWDANEKLIAALEAAHQAGYTGDDTVPPPDTPTYRKQEAAPKPKVEVTIGPAQNVVTTEVGKAQMISPEEMLRRIKESKDAEQQAHKFMLGRPRNA